MHNFLRVLSAFGLLCLIGSYGNAGITFEKTYGGQKGDYGLSVQQTLDMGYIIVGIAGTDTSFSSAYTWLIKTDPAGDTLWTKRFPRDYPYTTCAWVVQQTFDDSGYIIIGGSGGTHPGASLIKTNSFGDTLWTRKFDTRIASTEYRGCQTHEGGYVVTGGSWDGSNFHIWLLKTDSLGNELWEKTFYNSSQYGEWGNSVCQTSDSGYIIAGQTQVSGSLCGCLIKTDMDGNELWNRIDTTSLEYFCVRQTSDNGYIVVSRNKFIKVDSLGNKCWEKLYPFYYFDVPMYRCVWQTSDGGYVITGGACVVDSIPSYEDIILIKTDSLGDTCWTRSFGRYGRRDFGFSVQQTSDGGYIITGGGDWCNGVFIDTTSDVYLIKTDSLGNVGVEEKEVTPSKATLLQNYPNPFNPITSINYSVQKEGKVVIKVYNTAGQLVRTLVNTDKRIGDYTIKWDGKNDRGNKLAGGTYFYEMQLGDYKSTKKAIVLK